MTEATEAPHESKSWGSDVELEAKESKQTGFSLSLSLLPEPLHHADSPVEFLYDYLCPSPEARKAISFGMEDVLFTT